MLNRANSRQSSKDGIKRLRWFFQKEKSSSLTRRNWERVDKKRFLWIINVFTPSVAMFVGLWRRHSLSFTQISFICSPQKCAFAVKWPGFRSIINHYHFKNALSIFFFTSPPTVELIVDSGKKKRAMRVFHPILFKFHGTTFDFHSPKWGKPQGGDGLSSLPWGQELHSSAP